MAPTFIVLIALAALAHSYVLPGEPTDQRNGQQSANNANEPTYAGSLYNGTTTQSTVTTDETDQETGEYLLDNSGKYCCTYRPMQIDTTEPRQVVGTETYVITWNEQVGEEICVPREWLWYEHRFKRCPILEQRSRVTSKTVMTTIYETKTRTEPCDPNHIVCCSPLRTITPPWGGDPLCVDQETYDRLGDMNLG